MIVSFDPVVRGPTYPFGTFGEVTSSNIPKPMTSAVNKEIAA